MGWLPTTREHTFKTSGRSALITDAPNVYAVFGDEEIAPHLADYLQGAVEDPTVGLRIAEEIARSMLVRPRLLRKDEPVPADQDPEDPVAIPYSAMHTSEIDELVEMWSEVHERAARFREDADGPAGGGDGEGVGDDAKPRPRAKSRKRSGVAAR